MVIYTVVSYVRPTALENLSPRTGALSEEKPVGNAGDGRAKFLTPAGGTLMAHIYCTINNKTPGLGNSQDPISILRIGNAVKLQMVPGGASGLPKTELFVQTQNPDTTKAVETISVPDFPQQKWVHTCIVREGRRFTVYYNGKVVASERTTHYPAVNSSTIQVGDKRLQGEFAWPKVAPTPLRQDEVEQEILSTSDTRQKPYSPFEIPKGMFKFGCPNGLFCFTTEGQPQTNPLKMWKTPYA